MQSRVSSAADATVGRIIDIGISSCGVGCMGENCQVTKMELKFWEREGMTTPSANGLYRF